jgi:nitrite reductase/ring-hydroxylating ferredoxin subunit
MLTAAENEALVRVGRGTPMGDFMRQFWVPACRSSELVADGTPLRLKLLSEKLIAFRDTAGRVGIMDHRCPHRCASLFFGRNEQNGIRCVYHGWKFDVDGNCLDQPNLPDKNKYPAGTKAIAYKAAELGGLVYVYMGQNQAAPPPLPQIEALLQQPNDKNIALFQRDCNWLQALEGDVDTSHLAFLHAGCVDPDRMDPNDTHAYLVKNKTPEIGASVMPYGTMYAASRAAMEGFDHHRFAHFIFPFWVCYPSDRFERNMSVNAWVPIDDENTMVFNVDAQRAGGRQKQMSYADGTIVPGLARPMEYLPNTGDWTGRWRPVRNHHNDYLIDRDAQKRGESYSGLIGIPLQDQMVQEGMGPIVDRSMEHLGSSDRMVMITRKALLDAIRDHKEKGALPRVLVEPELARRATGGDMLVTKGVDWVDAYEEAMTRKYGPHPPVAAE